MNTEYKNQLLTIFNQLKNMIKENKRVPIIDPKHEYRKMEEKFLRPNGERVEICSISLKRDVLCGKISKVKNIKIIQLHFRGE